MSARRWLVAVAVVFGLASVGWAQGPGGRQCGGGGGPGMMSRGGGPGTMRGGPGVQMQQLQTLQLQQMQRQLFLQQLQYQQLQAQQTAVGLLAANRQGAANFARLQAARRAAQLNAGQ